MRRAIARDDGDEQAVNHGINGTHRDPPVLPGMRPPRGLHTLREHRERAARIGQERLPRLAERHAPATAHEERPANLGLQRPHPTADRRL